MPGAVVVTDVKRKRSSSQGELEEDSETLQGRLHTPYVPEGHNATTAEQTFTNKDANKSSYVAVTGKKSEPPAHDSGQCDCPESLAWRKLYATTVEPTLSRDKTAQNKTTTNKDANKSAYVVDFRQWPELDDAVTENAHNSSQCDCREFVAWRKLLKRKMEEDIKFVFNENCVELGQINREIARLKKQTYAVGAMAQERIYIHEGIGSTTRHAQLCNDVKDLFGMDVMITADQYSAHHKAAYATIDRRVDEIENRFSVIYKNLDDCEAGKYSSLKEMLSQNGIELEWL